MEKSISYSDIFWVPRMFAQHPFPKSDSANNPYCAANGNRVLIIQEGYDYDTFDEKPIGLGVPFGMIPRLMLLEITTKAKRLKRREISLAKNISSLLKLIKYEASGGVNGSITQLNTQVKRLLNCRISYEYFKNIKKPEVGKVKLFMGPLDEFKYWESTYDEDEQSIKNIKVKLHEHFYNEIINHAFPVKREHISKLRPSPFAIDLYLFISHRVFNLTRDTHISWKDLNKQFGSNYSNPYDFGVRARKYLKKIRREVYPEINFSFLSGRLVLKKSPPPVEVINN